MSAGLSLRGYARRRRSIGARPFSLSWLLELARAGVIPRDAHGQIDPDEADLAIARHLAAHRPAKDEAEQARAERLFWETRLLQQKHQVEGGVLVRADAVKLELFRRARGCRDALLSLPRRLAGTIATLDDAEAIRELIESEFTAALAPLDQPLRCMRGSTAQPALAAAPGGGAGTESRPEPPGSKPGTPGGRAARGDGEPVTTGTRAPRVKRHQQKEKT